MKLVLLALVLPFAGALLTVVLKFLSHRIRGFIVATFALASFLLLIIGGQPVFEGEALTWSWVWFPQLQIKIAFYLDSLALMFGLLITGIGF
ncbi:MAG: hypothetical protein ABEJ65_07820, partial [bacterium]